MGIATPQGVCQLVSAQTRRPPGRQLGPDLTCVRFGEGARCAGATLARRCHLASGYRPSRRQISRLGPVWFIV